MKPAGNPSESLRGADKAEGDRDREAVLRFIERFASALMDAGMPRMPARVFVALLASDSGRLTAAEMAEVLHVSPAAISGALRYLQQVNMLTRERRPGSRRDHYRLLDDSWYEMTLRREQVMARWIAAGTEGIDVLGPDTPAGRRMTESVEFFEFVRAELPALLERWRTQRESAT
jgi:DNA-binding transcriptional regulator GbsR (MarR family)